MEKKPQEYDVSIIGGGPAGLMAGLTAARRKLKALVIEKSTTVGEPVHTSGGSWISELTELGIPSNLYNPIKRAVFLSNSSKAEFKMDKAESCVLRVRELLQHLATEAISNGCDIVLMSKATSVENSETNVKVRYERSGIENTLISKYAIDASGYSSVANRNLKINETWKNHGYGLEYEAWFENLDKETIYLMVGSDYTQSGYAWIFPVDANRARIGAGFLKATSNANPKEYVDKMIRDNSKMKNEFGRIVPIETHSGVVPADGPVGRSLFGRVLLAGDSAGQVTPHIGEGIRFALKYGQLAASTVADVIQSDSTNAKNSTLENYQRQWKSEIGYNFKVALKLQDLFSRLTDDEWDKAVTSLNSLSNDEFTAFLRGDFSKKYLTSLLFKHPGLVRALKI